MRMRVLLSMASLFGRRKKDLNTWKGISVSGKKVRPQHGKCPQCHAEEREWCQPWCTTLDPVNMARE